MMVVTGSLPDLYKQVYGLNTLETGLCYISMGFGSLASALTMGVVVDWNFQRHARLQGIMVNQRKQQDITNFPIEKVRFEVIVPSHIIGTLAIIAFGWTLKFKTTIAGPEIALFFIGFGVSTSFNLTNTLLIDLHRHEPATATAAVNFVRCLMSAAGTAAILPLCHAINPGWAFTLIGLIYVLLLSVVFLLMAKGQQWRSELAAHRAAKAAAPDVAPTDVESQSSVSKEDDGPVNPRKREETE